MTKCSPPWQVLDLVADHLDPETIATACCVCKSWSLSMSSDHLWHPICSAAYPSLSVLRRAAAVPYRKLYSLGRVADRCRLQKPPKPRLSMGDFSFAVDIQSSHGPVATVLKSGGELKLEETGIFRFDIDFESGDWAAASFDEVNDSLRITWNVVLHGFKGIFTVMDCRGKGSLILGLEGWFSKELPPAGCCSSSGAASGMVADLRLGLRQSGGKVVAEKLSVGLLNISSWRYVCVDDALRYLQHFLLPC